MAFEFRHIAREVRVATREGGELLEPRAIDPRADADRITVASTALAWAMTASQVRVLPGPVDFAFSSRPS